MKKYYFAGSIRGGRDKAELYAEIIAKINEENKVLTEHIGAKNLEYLERNQTDEDIYEQDTGWIRECDALIAECSVPSLGVGYELSYAQSLGKPCYILFDKSCGRLSAMLAGAGYYEIFYYSSREELFEIIEGILKKNS